MIGGIDHDFGMRVIDDKFRLRKWVQTAQKYLEADKDVNVEAFIIKASLQ